MALPIVPILLLLGGAAVARGVKESIKPRYKTPLQIFQEDFEASGVFRRGRMIEEAFDPGRGHLFPGDRIYKLFQEGPGTMDIRFWLIDSYYSLSQTEQNLVLLYCLLAMDHNPPFTQYLRRLNEVRVAMGDYEYGVIDFG